MKFNRDFCLFLSIVAALWICSLVGCNRPDVDPNVEPVKGAELVIVVLDDANVRTPETGKILHDDQFWQKIKAEGHAYYLMDAANPSATQYKPATEKVGMPAILFYRARDMKLFNASKLPAETKLIDDLVAKYGGKKARGPPVYIDSDGEVRRLGMIPADAKAKARRQQMMGLGEFLGKKGVSLIPEDQWVEIDYPRFHKPEFVLDQRSTSGCVGFSAAAANMKMRALRGMPHERLSGAFVYSLINGGNDGGAMIDDSRIALTKYGVCLDTENPLPKIFWRQVSDEAKKSAETRQMLVAWRCDTIAEVATALQLGFIVQAGVQVDGNFSSFDANGISRANGRYANHSIHLYGMKKVDGKWVYRMGNTWGATWGPFRDGSCFLRPGGIVVQGDAFVHGDGEWTAERLPPVPPKPRKQLNNTPATPLANRASDEPFADKGNAYNGQVSSNRLKGEFNANRFTLAH